MIYGFKGHAVHENHSLALALCYKKEEKYFFYPVEVLPPDGTLTFAKGSLEIISSHTMGKTTWHHYHHEITSNTKKDTFRDHLSGYTW